MFVALPARAMGTDAGAAASVTPLPASDLQQRFSVPHPVVESFTREFQANSTRTRIAGHAACGVPAGLTSRRAVSRAPL